MCSLYWSQVDNYVRSIPQSNFSISFFFCVLFLVGGRKMIALNHWLARENLQHHFWSHFFHNDSIFVLSCIYFLYAIPNTCTTCLSSVDSNIDLEKDVWHSLFSFHPCLFSAGADHGSTWYVTSGSRWLTVVRVCALAKLSCFCFHYVLVLVRNRIA